MRHKPEITWTLDQIENRCRTADNGEPCEYAIVDDAANRVTACEKCRTCAAQGRKASGRAYEKTAMSPYARCPHPDGDRWVGVKPVHVPPKRDPSVTRPQQITGAADRMAICMHCEHHRREGPFWTCNHSGTPVRLTLGVPTKLSSIDVTKPGNCPIGLHDGAGLATPGDGLIGG